MEICIVRFDGSRTADRMLDSALGRDGPKAEWLREVAVIRRSRRGRVTTRAVYRSLGSPANPKASPSVAGRTVQLERDLFRIVELEELLEPNSSALLLVAEGTVCAEMEATFAGESGGSSRQAVLEDTDTTLRLLLESARAAAAEAVDE
jgi:hypothetical protein